MKVLFIVVIALALMTGAVSVYAEMVEGTVVSVDAVASTVTVNTVDAATGAEAAKVVSVTSLTILEGVDSIAALAAGDAVSLDATANAETGALEASSLKCIK